MTDISSLTGRQTNRRSLLKAGGALAAAGALTSFTFGIRTAGAQDPVTVTMWGNHPEWAEPMQALIDAFQDMANRGRKLQPCYPKRPEAIRPQCNGDETGEHRPRRSGNRSRVRSHDPGDPRSLSRVHSERTADER